VKRESRPTGLGRNTAVNILTFIPVILILLTSIFIPVKAKACSFPFDILSCFTGPKDLEADSKVTNSQNMALLQASISPNPQGSLSNGDIAIVGGTSLLAETQSASDSKVISPGSDHISLYVVHKGDTLSDIAKMFGVTKNTIIWANDLQGKPISVGQKLVILPISGVQYTVKKGDTLQSIAKLYKADLNDILQFNNLAMDSKIAVGDEIVIPDGEVTVSTPSSSKPSSNPSNSSGLKNSTNPVYDGYYMKPIVGGIKTQGIHGHNGVDLASAYGTNILASASGDVIIAKSSGWNGGYGNYVVISHPNGTQTLYGHMSSVEVSAGDHVEQGQVIGHMGSTGKSTGVHVHFEIRGARNPF
jgi:murein DD-endopeptidase MepM/ murein hydrolase activator NlpD